MLPWQGENTRIICLPWKVPKLPLVILNGTALFMSHCEVWNHKPDSADSICIHHDLALLLFSSGCFKTWSRFCPWCQSLSQKAQLFANFFKWVKCRDLVFLCCQKQRKKGCKKWWQWKSRQTFYWSCNCCPVGVVTNRLHSPRRILLDNCDFFFLLHSYSDDISRDSHNLSRPPKWTSWEVHDIKWSDRWNNAVVFLEWPGHSTTLSYFSNLWSLRRLAGADLIVLDG